MNFNLGAAPSASTTSTRLKANTIHTVQFDGAVADTIIKKDGSGDTFNVLRVKFKNDEGTYEETIFEPRAGDDQRPANNFGGENPAPMEELMFKIRHLIAAVAPAADAAINKKGSLNFGSWDDLRKFVVTNTAKSVGTTTQIKLIADKDGNPRFPGYVLSISKKGEVYPRTNFIGAKLAFTPKEMEKIEATTSAKPTQMPSNTPASTPVGSTGGDLDLDIDLL